MYANDILLMAPSVIALQQLLYACEDELDLLDMTISVNKSGCVQIGPRYKVKCNWITILLMAVRYCGAIPWNISAFVWQQLHFSYDYVKRVLNKMKEAYDTCAVLQLQYWHAFTN